MIQELILIGACISGPCKETTLTYLSHNPEQKAYLEVMEKRIQKYVPKYTPFLAAAARGEITVALNKNISVSYVDKTVSGKLVMGMEY